MAKVFSCKDFGGFCNWKGRAETKEELIRKITRHGAVKHNMKDMSATMLAKISASIKDDGRKGDQIRK